MSAPSEPIPSRSQNPARLLVAEDDPTLRSLVATALERAGYETLQAADGEEALRLATRHLLSFDLLLTDDRMPRMNGWELTCVLKALRPDLRVIVMSGNASVGPLAPGVVMLLKPFTLDTLWTLVAGMTNLRDLDGRRVLIRPEAVRVAPGEGALVAGLQRRGAAVWLRLRLADGEELDAVTTALDHPSIGDHVRVDIDLVGIVQL